jgi:hypothetical protein
VELLKASKHRREESSSEETQQLNIKVIDEEYEYDTTSSAPEISIVVVPLEKQP